MIRFENTIEINRPVEEVFSFIANFENIPRWNYYVLSVQPISGGLPGVGTVYHQVRKDDAQDYQIVDFQPSHKVRVRTTTGSRPSFERIFTFESIPARTRLIDVWELETGRNQLIERLGRGRIKAAVADNLGKLKQLLEKGETRLQDGRVSKL